MGNWPEAERHSDENRGTFFVRFRLAEHRAKVKAENIRILNDQISLCLAQDGSTGRLNRLCTEKGISLINNFRKIKWILTLVGPGGLQIRPGDVVQIDNALLDELKSHSNAANKDLP